MKDSSPTAENRARPPDLRTRAAHYALLVFRFSRRYGVAMLALIASAIIGWALASGVSDYTNGGWELHIVERSLDLNIHFHHWYYGLPLYLLAFAIIEWSATLSIFLFGLGQTLAAHSFINERGIPSIIEGGPVWHLVPEIYFPISTALALFYAFFIVRREEWLLRAREREEIATSYLFRRTDVDDIRGRLDHWAGRYLANRKERVDRDTNIIYGEWRAIDREERGEWQFHYVISRFDEVLDLLVVRLEHIPLEGRAGEMDNWIQELDDALKAIAQPAVGGSEFALQAIASPPPVTTVEPSETRVNT